MNPATTPKLVKALAAVAAAERVDVDDAGLAAIAAAAEGDVRCAIASLQMFAAGRCGAQGGRARAEDRAKPGSRKRKAPAAARRGAAGTEGDDDIKKTHPRDAAAAEAARRDRGLSVFHALGKILYNKRDDDSAIIRDGKGEDATETNGSFRDPSAPFSSGVPARGADGALWFGNAVPAFPLHATYRRARTKYASPETILALSLIHI